jgi:predicted MFS family arabinose efflux permease
MSAPQALPPSTRRTVLLLSLACFASMASQRICDAMLPELARQFDSTLAAAAQVVSLFALAYGLTQLLFGSLGDRYGKLRVLSYATLGCGLGSALAALAGSLQALVLARVLAAAFAAAIIPLSLAWTGDAVPYEKRQETLAQVGLGTTLGVFSGQVLGGLFTDTLGWRWAFVLMTLVFLLVGALLLSHRRSAQGPGDGPAQAGPQTSMLHQTRQLLRDAWVRKILGFSLCQGAAGFGSMAIAASHLHQHHGLALSSAGAIVALMGLGGMAYMSQAKRLVPRLGETGLAISGGLGMALALLTLAWSPWWQLTAAFMIWGGFSFFMLHNTLQTLATQMAPHARGLGVSMFATALFFGQGVGVLLATSLMEHWSASAVLSGAAAMMAGIGATVRWQLRQRRVSQGLQELARADSPVR